MTELTKFAKQNPTVTAFLIMGLLIIVSYFAATLISGGSSGQAYFTTPAKGVKAGIAVWRPVDLQTANWYIYGGSVIKWGGKGDVPVPADYNKDGYTELVVWRPSNGVWYNYNTGAQTQWGGIVSGYSDVPVPADYNGDGKAEIVVWRPSNGNWYLKDIATIQWGGIVSGYSDVPVPADYNGDGKADIAVWRPSDGKWWIKDITVVQWGQAGDVPVPADYNGDGKAEIVVWRPSNGIWYNRITGAQTQWGQAGDVPVVGRFAQMTSTPVSCTESNWNASLSPTTCPSTGQQTKTWNQVGTCSGGVTHPATETVACTYVPPPTCTDTDDPGKTMIYSSVPGSYGYNLAVGGTTTLGSDVRTDSCFTNTSSKSFLTENYCYSSSIVATIPVVCPGACNAANNACAPVCTKIVVGVTCTPASGLVEDCEGDSSIFTVTDTSCIVHTLRFNSIDTAMQQVDIEDKTALRTYSDVSYATPGNLLSLGSLGAIKAVITSSSLTVSNEP